LDNVGIKCFLPVKTFSSSYSQLFSAENATLLAITWAKLVDYKEVESSSF